MEVSTQDLFLLLGKLYVEKELALGKAAQLQAFVTEMAEKEGEEEPSEDDD